MWPGSIWKHCHRARHLPDRLSALCCMGRSHTKECRLVILAEACWPGGLPCTVDPRWCYRGVAEVSIYVGERFRGKGLAPSS